VPRIPKYSPCCCCCCCCCSPVVKRVMEVRAAMATNWQQ
jgi:hypothetical protein